MLGATMNTPTRFAAGPLNEVSSRHTSSAIEAPAPPAIDDTIRTIGGASS